MLVTNIIKLRKKSIEVDPKEAPEIIKKLEIELAKHKTGIGLSAIQIGINKKVSIVRFGNTKIDLINPKIIEKSMKIKYQKEGCLSILGLKIDTLRYKQVVIENNGVKGVAYDLEAIVIQHEIDHQNGKLILDRKWRRRR